MFIVANVFILNFKFKCQCIKSFNIKYFKKINNAIFELQEFYLFDCLAITKNQRRRDNLEI